MDTVGAGLGEDPLRLDRQVCFALAVATRSVLAVYRPVLDKLGLTHPQYLVMLAMWERSPRSVKDLSNSLLLDSATLSPLLKRLERAGYLSRSRNSTDERQLELELTDRCQTLRVKALAVPSDVVRRLGLPMEELHAMHAQLTRVIEAATHATGAVSDSTTPR